MEKITDFLKELKFRISNPLISSFSISWLIINWRIPIALLFYKHGELRADGYTSYFELIEANLNWNNTLVYPFGTAVVYTFFSPVIRTWISAFNSRIKKWSDNWNMSILKESKISVTEYIELRDTYKKRTEILEDVLSSEGKYLADLEQEKNKVLQLTNEKNQLSSDLLKWRSATDIALLNGEWEIHYPKSDSKTIYKVRIDGNIIAYQGTYHFSKNGSHTIRSLFRPPNTTSLYFTTYHRNSENKIDYHFFNLDTLDNMHLLRGYEDEEIEVEFRKIS